MAKKGGAAVAGEAKVRRRPDFSGTKGELVEALGLELVWGGRVRKSPYDALLQELVNAGPGKVLRFEDVKAKASVMARAKKLGLRVSFAGQGAALYVRCDGRVDDDVKASRRSKILELLRRMGPMGSIHLAVKLRETDPVVDGTIVDAICAQMLRAGEIMRREGGDWAAAPKRAA